MPWNPRFIKFNSTSLCVIGLYSSSSPCAPLRAPVLSWLARGRWPVCVNPLVSGSDRLLRRRRFPSRLPVGRVAWWSRSPIAHKNHRRMGGGIDDTALSRCWKAQKFYSALHHRWSAGRQEPLRSRSLSGRSRPPGCPIGILHGFKTTKEYR